jgi:hypothetical protein
MAHGQSNNTFYIRTLALDQAGSINKYQQAWKI